MRGANSLDDHGGYELPARFQDWFTSRDWSPRDHQLALCALAETGRNGLLIAPTGAGKTLAGFLPSLIDLDRVKPNRPRLHTLYISPLKALAVDVQRNLIEPVAEMGLSLRVEARTGDTPAARRQRQRRDPPDILLTTPEQVALLIASDHAREFFADLKAVIVDEVHALAATKRGDLLALGLATLRAFAPDVRLTGLSATVKDEAALSAWLGQAEIVRAQGGARPVVNVMVSEERIPWSGHSGRFAVGEIYERIKTAGTTLVFVNTRSQAELLFQELWRANEDLLPIALHHGSLDVSQRRKVEAAMAENRLKAVVCTSTLDLGIDWGDVDLVIQLGAPKGASRLVQRIGRANHRLNEASRAILVPTNRFEVLECEAAQAAVMAGELDGPGPRTGALDVLAQHVMGRACGEGFDLLALHDEVRLAAPYADLDWETFERVVDFVATGGYALNSYARFHRIVKRKDGLWHNRRAEDAQAHRMNVGAIVEAQALAVYLASRAQADKALKPRAGFAGEAGAKGRKGPLRRSGRKLGEVEEYFIQTLTPGDTFLFAGQVLRFEGLVEADVLATRSDDPEPAIPSYNGGKFPLSTFLAERVRQRIHDRASWASLPDTVREWFLIQEEKSVIPEPDHMLVETFPRADRHYLVAYPFEGRLAHQTFGMLLTRRLERAGKMPLGFVASEYALAIWGLEPMGDLDMADLFDQDMLGDDLEEWLEESPLMKRTFGHCARISGLIQTRFPGQEKTGRQVSFSTDLVYDVLRTHEPDHILLQAARNDAAEGLLDVRRVSDLLARVKGRITHMNLPKISPFAVPVMLEAGKEPVAGASAADAILQEAEDDLVRDALGR